MDLSLRRPASSAPVDYVLPWIEETSVRCRSDFGDRQQVCHLFSLNRSSFNLWHSAVADTFFISSFRLEPSSLRTSVSPSPHAPHGQSSNMVHQFGRDSAQRRQSRASGSRQSVPIFRRMESPRRLRRAQVVQSACRLPDDAATRIARTLQVAGSPVRLLLFQTIEAGWPNRRRFLSL